MTNRNAISIIIQCFNTRKMVVLTIILGSYRQCTQRCEPSVRMRSEGYSSCLSVCVSTLIYSGYEVANHGFRTIYANLKIYY